MTGKTTMLSISNAYQPTAQQLSPHSRFNERFSSSSNAPIDEEFERNKTSSWTILRYLGFEKAKPQMGPKRQNTFAKDGGAILRQRTKRMSNSTSQAYERRRSRAKEVALNHRQARKVQKEREGLHKRETKVKGIVWGYDPRAGQISRTTNTDTHGCYVFRTGRRDSDDYSVEEIDGFGRRTGRRWLNGSK